MADMIELEVIELSLVEVQHLLDVSDGIPDFQGLCLDHPFSERRQFTTWGTGRIDG